MSNKVTYWRGRNLGPQRQEFMKNNLRLEPIKITKMIDSVQDKHPYKQAGNVDSYSDYNQGWSDACEVILEKLK